MKMMKLKKNMTDIPEITLKKSDVFWTLLVEQLLLSAKQTSMEVQSALYLSDEMLCR